ncbi:ABC transporter permease subunit [Acinetobacter sp. MD2(2019)]|uniref:ABC transporter permease subunit n=1 Tax=Acinetobacter sp. MD2(2019) TaxID=2605273 RepID=UPI002D1E9828|nr:ABC transporter permease subunit [Acinetobacter sp. MD2(2019)]MEB3753741.1 ABC transporter permease subunit [Acinetobacter sp. MD2(2019)]
MAIYIFKRLVLMIPTLFFILLINFCIVQIAPGGPVEQRIQQIEQGQFGVLGNNENGTTSPAQYYQGARGLSPEIIEKIKAQYGFDQPAYVRFWQMLKAYSHFDFGESFFKGKKVSELLWEKMPVTLSLGGWSSLLIYALAIYLGIQKAKRKGTIFDQTTSLFLAMSYAVPMLVFGILLIVFFAGGSYFQWFPLQGLVSENFAQLSVFGKIKDYFWHLALPLLTMVLGGLASLSGLTKYSFIEEMHKQYVIAARAKGLTENRVWTGHIFKNAILVLVASLPETLIGVFFAGTLFVEILFNLDGLGLLGFEAVSQRDYPVIFGLLFVCTLTGMLLRLCGDVLYLWLDPRLHFHSIGDNS